MHDAHEFLAALTTVLCVAGVMTVLSQRLRQPVVLGYVLAGMVVGPHVPIPLVADLEIVKTLSELGVVLLMFSLGLEFSLQRLLRIGFGVVVTALLQCSVMFSLGFAVGEALGWSVREGLFAGAMLAISSTTIIAKAFEEERIGGRLKELVIGILIVEDLVAILLIALLPAAALDTSLSWSELAASTARLLGVLVVTTAVGLAVVPRTMRAILRLDRAETTLIASLGVCFGFASLALELGYSVALGAFLAGSLIAECGQVAKVEELVRPVRDLFAAIFFVSVGILIDPRMVVEEWRAIAALSAAVLFGKVTSVSLGAFLTGNGTRTSVQAGLSLAQIGEFSFIIASLGVAIGAVGEFMYPVAVAVSALTTVLTPRLIRAGPRAAALLDRKLPRRIQTFTALYGSWLERLGGAARETTLGARLRRLAGLLALDAALLAACIVATSVWAGALSEWLHTKVGVSPGIARALVVAAGFAVAAPLALGLVRVARRVGVLLAGVALPDARPGQLDLSIAPRRALVVTLQLGTVLIVTLPLLALLQPFLPPGASALGLSLVVVALGVTFWRSTADLQGHVRAGASAIIEALATQARGGPAPASATLAPVSQLLPGLGEPEAVKLSVGCSAAGRTLSELDLRGLTGATVLAITRGERSIVFPGAQERLEIGDLLALAGTREAVSAAKALLERVASRPRAEGN
jgi:CPA2 family monovalent cation:H+ antiporter-2